MKSTGSVNYRRRLLALIIITTTGRLFVASATELSNAEVYYWTYSKWLQLNYYDHPPIVAYLIKFTTWSDRFHHEIFVRLGAVIASAICTWLIYQIGAIVSNIETGWLAALLYSSSIYASLIAGAYILPDSPQMVFWLLGALLLTKISYLPREEVKESASLWYLFGIISGLCMMCKIHGIFLWIGAIGYALLYNRRWLQQRAIYLSALITLIIISPIIIWNLENHFITYYAYSGQLTLIGAKLRGVAFVKGLIEVILICNPINFYLIVKSLPWIFKQKLFKENSGLKIILLCSMPLLFVVLLISAFRDTPAHWAGPSYTCLLILAAVKLATTPNTNQTSVPTSIKFGLLFLIIATTSKILVTNYYPGTLSRQKEGLEIGESDPTLDDYGWEEAGNQFDSLYEDDVKKKVMPINAPLVVDKWFPGSHIEYYIASKTKQETVGIGRISDLGQFYWSNTHKIPLKRGDNAYYIIPSNLFKYKPLDKLLAKFDHYEMPLTITEFRNNLLCKRYYVFRLKGYNAL